MPLPAIAAKALPMLSKAFNSRGAANAANAAGVLGPMMPGAGGQGGGTQPPGMQAFQHSIAGRILSEISNRGPGQAPGGQS